MKADVKAAQPPVGREPVSRAGWRILTLVCAAQAMSLLDRQILSILARDIKADLHIGDAELGLLYGTVFALFYALFSLPLGRLADGWVRTRLLAICIAVWSFSTLMAAFASGFALLALSRLGVGIGEAASGPTGNSLVFDVFPKNRRGFAMGAVAIAIALGLGLSMMLGGLAADWWNHAFTGARPLGLAGWQFAFVVAALPGFILVALLLREREPTRGGQDGIATRQDPAPFRASLALFAAVAPVSHWIMLYRRRAPPRSWIANLAALATILAVGIALVLLAERLSPRPPIAFGPVALSAHVLQWSVVGFGAFVIVNLFQSLKLADRPAHAAICSPTLLLLMGTGALQYAINYGVMGFTPSFLMRTYGLSARETGLHFGLLSAGLGMLGPLLAGPLADRANRHLPGAGRIGLTLVSLGLSPLLAIWTYTAPDASGFYWRFTLYSLVLTMWMPPLYAMLYDLVLPRMRGVTSSTFVMISTLSGLGIGPYAVGMISDANGGDLASAILSVNLVAPVIVVLLVLAMLHVKRDEASLITRCRAAGEEI
ncbi:MFS transporter [Novosphingobium sp. 1949]|uniref:MFS transporter n=1 Tax=Novosphingobium organovorum TaxID=2930092 RepID=A0ABT0BEE8_9SPHN|nr:MFS transporter [Novosphingobium organovorum]MCJ2183445.1 MFS transporter [Novosphingobium organovorum]